MKRFTETSKWTDPWFRKLSPELKNLWQWLLDNCDNAGVIEPDLELASFQIGYQYPMDSLLGFGDRVLLLDCGKYFIPKFIAFQYGQLSESCKPHKHVLDLLRKYNIQRVCKGYAKGIHTLQDQDQDQDKEKDKERANNPKRYATFQQVLEFAASQPMPVPVECSESFFDRMEEIGWTDNAGLPLASWQARFRRYATNWMNNTANRTAK